MRPGAVRARLLRGVGRTRIRRDFLAVNLGIALAFACAVVTQLGLLCKHRGANAAPVVNLWRPIKSAGALMRSKWFALGMAIALAAWLLHVGALALAPLSMVQAVLSTGVIIVA